MTDYSLMTEQLCALAEGENHWLPLLANASALIAESLPDLNWAGFYLKEGESLLLGPFQGKIACVRIPWGKGVCGTAAAKDETQRVDDVHAFAGHIACDSASRSEIVVPIHRNGRVCAVLDLDSPLPGRFSVSDQEGLERLAREMEKQIDWRGL